MAVGTSALGKSMAAAVALCVVAVATAGSVEAAPAAGRAPVRVHVTAAQRVSAPAALRPGLADFQNTGTREILVVRAKRFGVARLLQDAKAKGPGPLLRDFVVVGSLTGKHATIVRLARGTYYLVDDEATKITSAAVHTTVVSGSVVNAALPAKAAPIAVNSAGVLHAAAKAASPGWLRISNASATMDLLELVRVRASAPTSAVRSFLKHPSWIGLAELAAGPFVASSVLGPHQLVRTNFSGHAGDWIVVTAAVTSRLPKLTAGSVALLSVH